MNLIWVPCEHENVAPAISKVLDRWYGARYLLGGSDPETGVSCTGLWVGVMNDLHGTSHECPRYAPEMAVGNPDRARKAVAMMKRLWPHHEVRASEDGFYRVEPGDVIVCRNSAGGGPGHVYIVGPKQNTVWHSPGPGRTVTWSGIAQAEKRCVHAYRLDLKWTW